MTFAIEPEYEMTKEDHEAYEKRMDREMLQRIWLINPEIQTMQIKKMVLNSEVMAIARAAIATHTDHDIDMLDMQGHIKASGV